MKMKDLYQVRSDASIQISSAIPSINFPAPLGGTRPAVTPSPEDILKSIQFGKDDSTSIHHLQDKRFLEYGIVAGRPIGPLCNPSPEPAERVEKQERNRVKEAQSQKTSLIHIDLTQG